MMPRPVVKALRQWTAGVGLLWASLLLAGSAMAHSSSNSYLTLSAADKQLTLRADIHWRDIDLIFDLDSNRDGQITWGETQSRSAEINTWLAQGIQLSASGQICTLGAPDLQASQHADGTYLSAQWAASCSGMADVSSADLTLRYGLIFAQDNLHRGLLKVDFPGYQSSALLSPERPEAQVSQADSSALKVFGRYVVEGVWHIWIGIDHILFLLSLLVLAPLQPSRQRVTQWRAAAQARPVVLDVLAVVTAFTVAHSITLGLSILKWLEPSADLIEPAIALSVVLAALNNLFGWSALKRWRLAFVFGLVHGFGFANVLLDLGLPPSALAAALGGFNVGVELGQLAIVLAFLPLAWWLRNTRFYRWVVVAGGSLAIVVLGLFWTLERTGLLA
ncbi:HupE/UreJ family protein [Limnohabitans sp.]|jgi:hypothetical protein|uniref:HupE/UreJ family protein n=1 Tax=Limnohabitans sp. TaxID=1907725 RepID=UPI0037BECE34